MSEPMRYSIADNKVQRLYGGKCLVVDPAGPLVEWKDYARLHSLFANSEQENARLKAEVERLTVEADWKTPARKIKALEAEVERLRKAGDDMASSIQFNEEMEKDYDGPTIVHPSVERWNAAKEGKPSV